MKTYAPLQTYSVTAAADLVKQRFIGFDGNLCAADAKALGVSDADTKSGQQCPVATGGILLVETAGAIAQGGKVSSDASGLAVPTGAGEVNGYTLDAAAGAGEVIRILRV